MYSVVLATMLTAGHAPRQTGVTRIATVATAATAVTAAAMPATATAAIIITVSSPPITPAIPIPPAIITAAAPAIPIAAAIATPATVAAATAAGSSYGCCYGGMIMSPQVMPVPNAPPPSKGGESVPLPKKAPEQVSARVTVNLPTDARLWVDNVECPLTSSVRSFNTPALNPGTRYTYNVKAEVVRDGRTVSETHAHRADAGRRNPRRFHQQRRRHRHRIARRRHRITLVFGPTQAAAQRGGLDLLRCARDRLHRHGRSRHQQPRNHLAPIRQPRLSLRRHASRIRFRPPFPSRRQIDLVDDEMPACRSSG